MILKVEKMKMLSKRQTVTRFFLAVSGICPAATHGEQEADDPRQGGLHRRVSWIPVLCNQEVN